MEEKIQVVKEMLEKYEQEQLLDNYENMTQKQQEDLLNEILTIDFSQIEKLYEQTKKQKIEKTDVIEPISYIEKAK